MEQQLGGNLTDINPYLLIYCNMGLKISEGMSPDTAQNVARQLGYLYNAIGHVTKDLIKILATIMPQHVSQPQSNPFSPQPVPPPQPTHIPQRGQEMEIEQPLLGRSAHKKGRSSGEGEGIGQKRGGQESKDKADSIQREQQHKPPNISLFDQFAYPGPSDQATLRDQNFKESVAKLVQEVTKKRKDTKKESKWKVNSKPSKTVNLSQPMAPSQAIAVYDKKLEEPQVPSSMFGESEHRPETEMTPEGKRDERKQESQDCQEEKKVASSAEKQEHPYQTRKKVKQDAEVVLISDDDD